MKFPFFKKASSSPEQEPLSGSEANPVETAAPAKKSFKLKFSIRGLFSRAQKPPPESEPQPETENAPPLEATAPPPAPDREAADPSTAQDAPQDDPNPDKKSKGKPGKDKPAKEKRGKKKKLEGADAPGEKKSKKLPLLLMILGAVLLVSAVVLLVLFLTKGEPPTPEEQLEQAALLTQDEDYDKADKIYEALLQEDETLVDAYLGRAENTLAREDDGHLDSAVEILTQGYEITEDSRIRERLNLLLPETEAGAEPLPPTYSEEPIQWKDPALEAMIRDAIGKDSDAPISEADLKDIQILKILGNAHIAVNQSLNAYNSPKGYRIGDQLYTERGNIQTLADLAHFPNLKKLTIGYNQISDLTGIENLTQLHTVGLYFNDIADLTPVSSLKSLKALYIYHNQINDLTPLSGLSQLQYLYLQNNGISDLSPLAELHELTELYLNNNQISDISPVAGLKSLQQLHANNNQISSLTPLQSAASLKEIAFNGNPVSDYSPTLHIPIVNEVKNPAR